MENSEIIRGLIDEMQSLERQTQKINRRHAEIKREIAFYLGLTTVAEPAEPEKAPTKPPPEPKTVADKVNPASVGTKGRAVLEKISALGGKARAPEIAEGMSGIGDERKHQIKRVRTYIFHLSQTGYIEKTGERGEWRISELGHSALGKGVSP